MVILASVIVPHHLSNEIEILNTRQSNFTKEVDEICIKYLNLGNSFNRDFNFNERLAPHDTTNRILYEFPKELNIPEDMQKELAEAWVKLFAH
jgi:hypothetical protein